MQHKSVWGHNFWYDVDGISERTNTKDSWCFFAYFFASMLQESCVCHLVCCHHSGEKPPFLILRQTVDVVGTGGLHFFFKLTIQHKQGLSQSETTHMKTSQWIGHAQSAPDKSTVLILEKIPSFATWKTPKKVELIQTKTPSWNKLQFSCGRCCQHTKSQSGNILKPKW